MPLLSLPRRFSTAGHAAVIAIAFSMMPLMLHIMPDVLLICLLLYAASCAAALDAMLLFFFFFRHDTLIR